MRYTQQSCTRITTVLVAEVVELQRDLKVLTLEQTHHFLKVVALLAGDTNGVALGLAADSLGTFFLDQSVDLASLVGRDSYLDGDDQSNRVMTGLFDLAVFETTQRNSSLDEAFFEHDLEGVQSVFADRSECDHKVFLLNGRFGVLEIEAGGDFTLGLVDRILDFLVINFGNNIKCGHIQSVMRPTT